MIPSEFTHLFWEYDDSALSLELHRRFIISRVINFGTIPALQWLFKTYELEILREVVQSSNNLHESKRRFWEIVFNIEIVHNADTSSRSSNRTNS